MSLLADAQAFVLFLCRHCSITDSFLTTTTTTTTTTATTTPTVLPAKLPVEISPGHHAPRRRHHLSCSLARGTPTQTQCHVRRTTDTSPSFRPMGGSTRSNTLSRRSTRRASPALRFVAKTVPSWLVRKRFLYVVPPYSLFLSLSLLS